MKTIFCASIIMSMVLLFSQCEKEPDPNEIVDIPDDEFLRYLILDGVDTNGDGLISYGEAEKVTTIYLDPGKDSTGRMNGKVSNVEGIEAFINLDTLHCCFNQIQELDVSANTELRVLVCMNNYDNGQLTSLDVSKNEKLKWIFVAGHQLTSLDISKATELEFLWCDYNQLNSLDVSHNTNLSTLSCGGNQLTRLDISKATDLETLMCYYNQLNSLDVSHNTNLSTLSCEGNLLTGLDISNNLLLNYLRISYMPSLDQVCVWEVPFPPNGIEVIVDESPNIIYTTDCNQ